MVSEEQLKKYGKHYCEMCGVIKNKCECGFEEPESAYLPSVWATKPKDFTKTRCDDK